MNKRIAISVITVLAVGVSAAGYFVVQQSNKLGETESEIVALEQNVSALEENVSTLEENGSVLEVELSDLEAKVSTLEAALEEANDDVELQQKLVGSGACAEWTYPGETDVNHLDTGFFLTNPDGVSGITIDHISVFAYDGTVVYEGPLRVKVDDEWEVYTGPLKPHETLQTGLGYYDLPELTHEVEMWYTVEVFWRWTDKEGLPLTGFAASFIVVRDAVTGEAIDIIMSGTTQMVNMEQALDSED
jgi:hypothetical protein